MVRIKFKDLKQAQLSSGYLNQFVLSVIVASSTTLVGAIFLWFLKWGGVHGFSTVGVSVLLFGILMGVYLLFMNASVQPLILKKQLCLIRGHRILKCLPLTEWDLIQVETGLYGLIIIKFISKKGNLFFEVRDRDGCEVAPLLIELFQSYPDFKEKLVLTNPSDPYQYRFIEQLKKSG